MTKENVKMSPYCFHWAFALLTRKHVSPGCQISDPNFSLQSHPRRPNSFCIRKMTAPSNLWEMHTDAPYISRKYHSTLATPPAGMLLSATVSFTNLNVAAKNNQFWPWMANKDYKIKAWGFNDLIIIIKDESCWMERIPCQFISRRL